MADATVGYEATDIFALGGNFHAQSSTTRTTKTEQTILDALGNAQCTTMIDETTNVSVPYGYCNAVPDIATDLGVFLTQFGNVHNGYLQTGMTITFTAGQQATVDISGHNHGSNAHAAGLAVGYADVSAAVPANAGFGVPTPAGVTLGDNATPISMTISFASNHVDKIGATGTHFVGKNLTIRADMTVQYQGVPTTAEPMTGWTTQDKGGDDANTDADTYEVTAFRYFDLATV